MRFEKVSLKQFEQSLKKYYTSIGFDDNQYDYKSFENSVKKDYDNIILPKRSTKGSAGYDFYIPFGVHIRVGESQLIPTGIRCVDMPENIVLKIYPRSGLGAKKGLVLRNTVGIIDSDYAQSDNEGHIMIKLVNYGIEPVVLTKGSAFCQGIFSQYFTVDDDNVEKERNGGFGSTDKEKK